jgi:hypothetical protein
VLNNIRVELTASNGTCVRLGSSDSSARTERNPVLSFILVNRSAGCFVIATLLDLGKHGFTFYGLAEEPWFLLAADGNRSVVAQAMVTSRYPVIELKEDGTLLGVDQARRYYDVLAVAKGRMRAADEDHRRY